MDRSDKNNVEQENRNEDPITYNSQTSDWPFCSANLTSMPMNFVAPGNSSAVCKENVMGSSASVVDSFATTLWDHPTNLQNMGYCDINVQSSLGTLSTLGCGKVGPPSVRSDVNWNPSVSMLKEALFLPNGPGTMPESLTQFPADSGFIERAARFSCFNGGNFSNMVNPFGIHESMGLYPGVVGVRIPDPREVVPGGQPQRSDVSVGEGPKDVVLSANKQGASEGSPLKNDGRSESIVRSHDEGRQVIAGSGNESDEAEFSGGGAGQDDPSAFEGTEQEVPAKGLSSKKRKRNGPMVDAENDAKLGPQPSENGKDSNETQARIDQTPNSLVGKATGKNSKQGSQASDPPKEEYIHVRARRGQATNSHSLAERVRREKISERMKFLQDLVPGCSKVTGKAVMLDEIINYVQSLQRQVEFLSMKLATVNPRLEFNLEGLLTKDLLQSRLGPSSTLGFFPELPVVYPPVHTPASRIQGGLPAAGNPDAMRRPIHSQLAHLAGGLKESSQLPNMWEDELNHVVQMGFPGSATPSSQEVDASEQPGHTKVEL